MRNKLLVLGLFIVVNIFASQYYWRQLVHDTSQNEARFGEVLAWEWGVEQVYQNMVAGSNPFAVSRLGLYPFGTDLSSADAGSNALFFLPLRPFLSTHQALSVTVALGIMAANMGMYLLLKKLSISNLIAVVIALAFGYTTYLQPRAGHLTYMAIYVFPWFWWGAVGLWQARKPRQKLLYALSMALFMTLALYHNLYYFVMLAWSVVFLTLYGLMWERRPAWLFIVRTWRYLLAFVLAMTSLLYPWLVVVIHAARFEGLPTTDGWGGAIGFSSDLFGYFIPSIYSKYFGGMTTWLGTKVSFVYGIFENFSYPGILILGSYAFLLILFIKRKLPSNLLSLLKPWLFAGVCFWVLTLGPFLHVLGKWTIPAPDGIQIVIPLPYTLFHYLPFMANIRSPARLTIAFILFSSIIAAYLLDYAHKHLSQGRKKLFLVCLLAILYLDHTFTIPPADPQPFPSNIYATVSQYSGKGAVYEMPSVVRDGFKYFGNLDSLTFIAGQYRHGKPVMAGYNGRISSYKREYYQRNPFLGYMGRLMDSGVENNGAIDRTELPKWQYIDLSKSAAAIDFLDIKYTILQDDAFYSATAAGVLAQLNFSQIMIDDNYSLWERELSATEYLSADVGVPEDDMYLGLGWRGRDDHFRWSTTTSSFMLKVGAQRDMELVLAGATYYLPQEGTVYVNGEFLGKLAFTPTMATYTLPVRGNMLQIGINTFHIKFPKSYQPSIVDPLSKDESHLSAKFSHFELRTALDD